MQSIRSVRWWRSALAAAALVAALGVAAAAQVPNFTFIHTSDEHVPHSGTPDTIAELGTIGEVFLEPYGVTAAAPSFVIETGDMTEFGPKGGAWALLNEHYANVSLPRYMVQGNHDGTWRSLRYELRGLYGAPYYSFDKFGCRFVMIDSAGLQDPRPVIGPEQIEWLRADLATLDEDTPVFVALHHPLDGKEYSSPYETDRLLDALRPYNVVLVMVGHSHGYKHVPYAGVEMVHGGSAWGPGLPGYQVVSVLDGVLRVAYKERGKPSAATPTFTRPVEPPAKRYSAISIHSPKDQGVYRAQVPIKAWIRLGPDEVKEAFAEIDGKQRVNLERKPGGSFDALVPEGELAPGAHYMRVSFLAADDAVYHRSCCFYMESDSPRAAWRAFMGSASKSTPAIAANTVYVGANDGRIRAYDRVSGSLKWAFAASGAITGEPLVIGDRVIAGSEDRFLYCLNARDGSPVWKFEADDPIYSAPVTDGSAVYFGCGTGAFYSVDPTTGAQNWKNTDAAYCIESKPFLADGKVYYGAWDTYVYCVNTADGSLVWKCMGQGSAEGVAPAYYSPADCGPVVSGGKVYAADRKYYLSVIDASTGKLVSSVEKVSAVALSSDGNHLYLRRNGGALTKTDLDCQTVWEADVSMDDAPAAPYESGGIVYVSSKRGLVSAVSAADGGIVWQYQATPSSYVLSSVAAVDGAAYVSGTDGSLTALK